MKLAAKFRFSIWNKYIYEKMQTSVRIEKKNENLKSTRGISFCPKIDKNRKHTEQITI